jgi:hypothetical protein
VTVRVHVDGRGVPRIRIIEEGGCYVISVDIFRQLKEPPNNAEVLQIGERYKILVTKRALLRGTCEFVYFQFPGGVQLINVKYIGPDSPDDVLPELDKLLNEVAHGEEHKYQ